MARDTLFVDPETTELDLDQIYAEARPLAKLLALFIGIALVPLLFGLALGNVAGLGGLFFIVAQFFLAIGVGLTLMYVIVRARILSPYTPETDHPGIGTGPDTPHPATVDRSTSHDVDAETTTEPDDVDTSATPEPDDDVDADAAPETDDDVDAVEAQRAQAATDTDEEGGDDEDVADEVGASGDEGNDDDDTDEDEGGAGQGDESDGGT